MYRKRKTALFSRLSAFGLGLLLLAQSHPVQASEEVVDVDAAFAEADFVFEGVVESMVFRLSRAVGEQPAVPHTFVTYRVERAFKGQAANNRVTLRFLGGRNGDQVMMGSNAPLIDVGDRDVLFVKGNGLRHCPLVRCAGGRFRVLGDAMYTERGVEVIVSDGQTARLGTPRNRIEVNRWVAGGVTLDPGPAIGEADPAAAGALPPAPLPVTRAAAAVEFRNFLVARVNAVFTREELARVPAVASARADLAFNLPALRAVAPRL